MTMITGGQNTTKSGKLIRLSGRRVTARMRCGHLYDLFFRGEVFLVTGGAQEDGGVWRKIKVASFYIQVCPALLPPPQP